MALNWVQPKRLTALRMRADDLTRQLMRENARLGKENQELRCRCQDLSASAEYWIRLYEAALGRASGGRQEELSRSAGERVSDTSG